MKEIIRRAILSKIHTLGTIWIVCVFASPSTTTAAKAALVYKNPSLNVMHGFYRDGEFDSLLQAMKTYPSRQLKLTFEDSLFLAKHYAVIYAATPETHEKSRYYMRQMLEIDPHSDFVGMFATENVDRLFENVRKEFFLTHTYSPKQGFDSLENEKLRKLSGPIWWWWVGGAAVITGGAIALWVFNIKSEKDSVQTVDFFEK